MAKKKMKTKVALAAMSAAVVSSSFAVTATNVYASKATAEQAIAKAEKAAVKVANDLKYSKDLYKLPNAKLLKGLSEAIAKAKVEVAKLKGMEKKVLSTRLAQKAVSTYSKALKQKAVIQNFQAAVENAGQLSAAIDDQTWTAVSDIALQSLTKQVKAIEASLKDVADKQWRQQLTAKVLPKLKVAQKEAVLTRAVLKQYDAAKIAIAQGTEAAATVAKLEQTIGANKGKVNRELGQKYVELLTEAKQLAATGSELTASSTDENNPSVIGGTATAPQVYSKDIVVVVGKGQFLKISHAEFKGNLRVKGAGTVILDNVKAGKINVEDVGNKGLILNGVTAAEIVVQDNDGANIVAQTKNSIGKLSVSDKSGESGGITLTSQQSDAFKEVVIDAKQASKKTALVLNGDFSKSAIKVNSNVDKISLGSDAKINTLSFNTNATVSAQSGAKVEELALDTDKTVVTVGGDFGLAKVTLNGKQSQVIFAKDAKVGTVNVNAEAKVTAELGAQVTQVNVAPKEKDSKVTLGGSLNNATVTVKNNNANIEVEALTTVKEIAKDTTVTGTITVTNNGRVEKSTGVTINNTATGSTPQTTPGTGGTTPGTGGTTGGTTGGGGGNVVPPANNAPTAKVVAPKEILIGTTQTIAVGDLAADRDVADQLTITAVSADSSVRTVISQDKKSVTVEAIGTVEKTVTINVTVTDSKATVSVPMQVKVKPVVAAATAVVATNGTVTVTLDKVPTVDPVLADFVFEQRTNNATSEALKEVKSFVYDKAKKTVTIAFKAVEKQIVVQNVVVKATYKGAAVSATAFQVDKRPPNVLSVQAVSVNAKAGLPAKVKLAVEGQQELVERDATWTTDDVAKFKTAKASATVHKVTVSYKDMSDKVVSSTVDVTVIDAGQPVISPKGQSVTLPFGAKYVELGATVEDNNDDNLPVMTTYYLGATKLERINTLEAGEYTVKYEAKDAANNSAEPKTITVTVQAQNKDNLNKQLAKSEDVVADASRYDAISFGEFKAAYEAAKSVTNKTTQQEIDNFASSLETKRTALVTKTAKALADLQAGNVTLATLQTAGIKGAKEELVTKYGEAVSKLTNPSFDDIQAAVAAVNEAAANEKAAAEVTRLIGDLRAELAHEDKAKVDEAHKAYDELVSAAKKLVSEPIYSKLVNAIETIAAIEKVNALPEEITLEHKFAIEVAADAVAKANYPVAQAVKDKLKAAQQQLAQAQANDAAKKLEAAAVGMVVAFDGAEASDADHVRKLTAELQKLTGATIESVVKGTNNEYTVTVKLVDKTATAKVVAKFIDIDTPAEVEAFTKAVTAKVETEGFDTTLTAAYEVLSSKLKDAYKVKYDKAIADHAYYKAVKAQLDKVVVPNSLEIALGAKATTTNKIAEIKAKITVEAGFSFDVKATLVPNQYEVSVRKGDETAPVYSKTVTVVFENKDEEKKAYDRLVEKFNKDESDDFAKVEEAYNKLAQPTEPQVKAFTDAKDKQQVRKQAASSLDALVKKLHDPVTVEDRKTIEDAAAEIEKLTATQKTELDALIQKVNKAKDRIAALDAIKVLETKKEDAKKEEVEAAKTAVGKPGAAELADTLKQYVIQAQEAPYEVSLKQNGTTVAKVEIKTEATSTPLKVSLDFAEKVAISQAGEKTITLSLQGVNIPFKVTVVDTEKPQINIAKPMVNVEYGQTIDKVKELLGKPTYEDNATKDAAKLVTAATIKGPKDATAKAFSLDTLDANLTKEPGKYVITYKVKDEAGNEAEVTQTLEVGTLNVLALREEIAKADAKRKETDAAQKYDEDTLTKLETAINKAKEKLADKQTLQSDIDALTESLKQAIAGVKTKQEAAIEKIKTAKTEAGIKVEYIKTALDEQDRTHVKGDQYEQLYIQALLSTVEADKDSKEDILTVVKAVNKKVADVNDALQLATTTEQADKYDAAKTLVEAFTQDSTFKTEIQTKLDALGKSIIRSVAQAVTVDQNKELAKITIAAKAADGTDVTLGSETKPLNWLLFNNSQAGEQTNVSVKYGKVTFTIAKVTVKDTVKPTIDLTDLQSSYDFGATLDLAALIKTDDNVKGTELKPTIKVEFNNQVLPQPVIDTTKPGVYTVTVTLKDAANNEANPETKNVTVKALNTSDLTTAITAIKATYSSYLQVETVKAIKVKWEEIDDLLAGQKPVTQAKVNELTVGLFTASKQALTSEITGANSTLSNQGPFVDEQTLRTVLAEATKYVTANSDEAKNATLQQLATQVVKVIEGVKQLKTKQDEALAKLNAATNANAHQNVTLDILKATKVDQTSIIADNFGQYIQAIINKTKPLATAADVKALLDSVNQAVTDLQTAIDNADNKDAIDAVLDKINKLAPSQAKTTLKQNADAKAATIVVEIIVPEVDQFSTSPLTTATVHYADGRVVTDALITKVTGYDTATMGEKPLKIKLANGKTYDAKVNVRDKEAPKFTQKPELNVKIKQGSTYIPTLVTAEDNSGKAPSVSDSIVGPNGLTVLNTNVAGTYKFTKVARDESGNESTYVHYVVVEALDDSQLLATLETAKQLIDGKLYSTKTVDDVSKWVTKAKAALLKTDAKQSDFDDLVTEYNDNITKVTIVAEAIEQLSKAKTTTLVDVVKTLQAANATGVVEANAAYYKTAFESKTPANPKYTIAEINQIVQEVNEQAAVYKALEAVRQAKTTPVPLADIKVLVTTGVKDDYLAVYRQELAKIVLPLTDEQLKAKVVDVVTAVNTAEDAKAKALKEIKEATEQTKANISLANFATLAITVKTGHLDNYAAALVQLPATDRDSKAKIEAVIRTVDNDIDDATAKVADLTSGSTFAQYEAAKTAVNKVAEGTTKRNTLNQDLAEKAKTIVKSIAPVELQQNGATTANVSITYANNEVASQAIVSYPEGFTTKNAGTFTSQTVKVAGNVEIVVTINVIDTEKPTVELKVAAVSSVAYGDTAPTISASDVMAKDNLTTAPTVTYKIKFAGQEVATIDSTKLGDYTVTYTVTDEKGLTASVERTISVIRTDKAQLKKEIEKVKALKEADYTPTSWTAQKAAIENAIKAAEDIAFKTNPTQAEVTTALTNLTNAVNGLVLKVTEVEAKIDALPEVATVTSAHKQAVNAAETLFNALTVEQRAQVTAAKVTKLTALLHMLTVIEAVEKLAGQTISLGATAPAEIKAAVEAKVTAVVGTDVTIALPETVAPGPVTVTVTKNGQSKPATITVTVDSGVLQAQLAKIQDSYEVVTADGNPNAYHIEARILKDLDTTKVNISLDGSGNNFKVKIWDKTNPAVSKTKDVKITFKSAQAVVDEAWVKITNVINKDGNNSMLSPYQFSTTETEPNKKEAAFINFVKGLVDNPQVQVIVSYSNATFNYNISVSYIDPTIGAIPKNERFHVKFETTPPPPPPPAVSAVLDLNKHFKLLGYTIELL